MSKINLTNKSFEEQARIVKDYLSRRKQHKEQGEVAMEQLVKKFKHKELSNDKKKSAHLKKLLKKIEKENSGGNNS